MNTIGWYNYDNATADAFKIYRSIPGMIIPFASLSQNPMFRFAATSPDIQEIVVSTTNIDAAVTSINTGKGIQAVKSVSGTHIYVRLLAQKDTRLKLYKCTLLEDLGLQPQIIVPGLNFQLIGGVIYTAGPAQYTFQDLEGSYLDTYYLTTIEGVKESIPSVIQSSLLPGVSYCIAEARFINIQGRPVKGVRLEVEPAVLDGSGFSTNKIIVFSDAYGRVAVPLIQCQQYVLHIPAIGYNQFIDVPQANFLDITQWPANTGPEFSPFGDVP